MRSMKESGEGIHKERIETPSVLLAVYSSLSVYVDMGTGVCMYPHSVCEDYGLWIVNSKLRA